MITIPSHMVFDEETTIIIGTVGLRPNLQSKISGVISISGTPDDTIVGAFTRELFYIGSTVSSSIDGTYSIISSLGRMPLTSEVIVIAFDNSGSFNSEIADHVLPVLND